MHIYITTNGPHYNIALKAMYKKIRFKNCRYHKSKLSFFYWQIYLCMSSWTDKFNFPYLSILTFESFNTVVFRSIAASSYNKPTDWRREIYLSFSSFVLIKCQQIQWQVLRRRSTFEIENKTTKSYFNLKNKINFIYTLI